MATRLKASSGVSPRASRILSHTRFHRLRNLPALNRAYLGSLRMRSRCVFVAAEHGRKAHFLWYHRAMSSEGTTRPRLFVLSTSSYTRLSTNQVSAATRHGWSIRCMADSTNGCPWYSAVHAVIIVSESGCCHVPYLDCCLRRNHIAQSMAHCMVPHKANNKTTRSFNMVVGVSTWFVDR